MKFSANSKSLVLTRLPRPPLLEPVVALALGAAVGWRFGIVWGVLAGAIEVGLAWTAYRHPARAVGLLMNAFALPRFESVQEAPFYLRAEDFVIAALFAAAIRRKTIPPDTPLDNAISIYAGALGLTCLTGLALGTIASPLQSALTLLKHVELLCCFFAAAWALRTKEDRQGFANAALTVVAGLGVAAAVFLALAPELRPFNRAPYVGQSNHVAGFAALLCVLCLTRRSWPGCVAALLLLLSTGSRTAMVGLAAALGVLLLTTRSKAALGLLAAGVFTALLLPNVRQRIRTAPTEWELFRSTEERVARGAPPHYSTTRNRFEVWSLLIEEYRRFPIFGTGPGSRHRVLYENQYLMTACESGLVGLAAFLFLMWTGWRTFHGGGTPEAHAALAGLAALLAMGITSNAFTISQMAGPWWLMAGAAAASMRSQTR